MAVGAGIRDNQKLPVACLLHGRVLAAVVGNASAAAGVGEEEDSKLRLFRRATLEEVADAKAGPPKVRRWLASDRIPSSPTAADGGMGQERGSACAIAPGGAAPATGRLPLMGRRNDRTREENRQDGMGSPSFVLHDKEIAELPSSKKNNKFKIIRNWSTNFNTDSTYFGTYPSS